MEVDVGIVKKSLGTKVQGAEGLGDNPRRALCIRDRGGSMHTDIRGGVHK